MQATKCDRCGKYFDENRDFEKTGIIFIDENGVTSGGRIDLCDDCIDKLDVWLKRCIKER